MVSTLPVPSKSKPYLLAARLSTLISSMSLLADGLSFQSPTKGSSASAPNAQVAKLAEIADRLISRDIRSVNFTLSTGLRGLSGPKYTAGLLAQWIGWAYRHNLSARAFPDAVCPINRIRSPGVLEYRPPVEDRVPQHPLIAAVQIAVQRVEIEGDDVALALGHIEDGGPPDEILLSPRLPAHHEW